MNYSNITFVGRHQEMADLVVAFDDTIAGRGRLVMLSGDPGIGKTRIAQQLAEVAEQRGAKALWGRCYEEQGAPPFWPWTQLLKSYIFSPEVQQLEAEMGAGIADVAEVIPEMRQRLPSIQLPPQLEPAQARFRLFSSITTFLKNASQTRPLLLVLDDLHWADRSSLLLLEFVAQEIDHSRIMILGTYRDADVTRRHTLSESLGTLVRQHHFRALELSGINQDEVRELAEITRGTALEASLIERIYRRTEGNPLFVGEIVRLLEREDRPRWDVSIPTGVRNVIGRRLNRLSEECNEALTVASVIGREFNLTLLERLMEGHSSAMTLNSLEEAAGAGVIEETPRDAGEYQFSHALIQETLLSELSLTRRARLHARIAELLEEVYADDLDAHVAALAYHYGGAEVILGSDKLVKYSLIAGEQALAAYAWEEALEYFERGLSAKEEQSMDAEKAALLFGLGQTQAAVYGREGLQEAVDNLYRAFDYFSELGYSQRAVQVAMYPFPHVHGSKGIVSLLERALELVPHDSLEAGIILSRYGLFAAIEIGDYELAIASLGRALEIAKKENDTTLEARIFANRSVANSLVLHLEQALEDSVRSVELARSNGDVQTEFQALEAGALVAKGMGRKDDAWRYVLDALELAERLGSRYTIAFATSIAAFLSALEGNWSQSRAYAERGLSVSPQEYRLIISRMLIEAETGEAQAALSHYREVLNPRSSWFRRGNSLPATAYLALISGITEGLDLIKQRAGEIIASSKEATPLFYARTAMGLVAAHQGDIGLAQEQYRHMLPTEIRIPHLAMLSMPRFLGILAYTMGNLDTAQIHFEDALAFCRKGGYKPELAWTCYYYADTLLQREDSGDYTRAMSLLEEAHALSTELGMRPLMEKVAVLMESAQSTPRKGRDYPQGLTEREVEILRLVASGRSNAAIAGELVLSVRTVERHISNIYIKTNTHGRAEATAFAFTHELMPPNASA